MGRSSQVVERDEEGVEHGSSSDGTQRSASRGAASRRESTQTTHLDEHQRRRSAAAVRVRRRSARMPLGPATDRRGSQPRQRLLAGSASARARSGLRRRAAAAGGGLALALCAALGALLAHRRRPSTQLRSSRAPASPDFSGWNWVAHSGPFSTAATNRSPPCSAQVHQRRAGAAVGDQLPVADAVGVHEVEPLVLDAGEQHATRAATSTVFQPMCGTTGACSRSTPPGHSPQPSVVDAVLDARARTAPACRRRCRAPAGRRPAGGR